MHQPEPGIAPAAASSTVAAPPAASGSPAAAPVPAADDTPGGPTDGAGGDDTVHNDIRSLLNAYYEVLHLYEPPRSVRARGGHGRSWNQLAAEALRPRVGYRRFLIRHIRDRIVALDRAFAIRLATRQTIQAGGHDLDAIERMRDALPQAAPRWLAVAALVSVILLTQVLLRGLDAVIVASGGSTGGQDLGAQLTTVTAPNVTSIDSLVSTVAHAYPGQVFEFLLALGLAIYLLFRLPVGGLRLSRMMLNVPSAIGRRHRGTPLSAFAAEQDVYGREQAVFRDLHVQPPREIPADLLVKASVWFGVWFAVVYGLRSYIIKGHQSTLIEVLVVGSLTAARLAWLVTASARRRNAPGTGLLLLGIALVTLPAALASVNPTAAGDRAELAATTNNTSHAELQQVFNSFNDRAYYNTSSLQGIDLRARDLDGLELSTVDLMDADLSDADLSNATLTKAVFINASLGGADLADALLGNSNMSGADLADANLTGASLDGTNLTGANLSGADLTGACYDAGTRWPSRTAPPGTVRKEC